MFSRGGGGYMYMVGRVTVCEVSMFGWLFAWLAFFWWALEFFLSFFLVRTVRYLLYKLSNWLSSVLIKFRFS